MTLLCLAFHCLQVACFALLVLYCMGSRLFGGLAMFGPLLIIISLSYVCAGKVLLAYLFFLLCPVLSIFFFFFSFFFSLLKRLTLFFFHLSHSLWKTRFACLCPKFVLGLLGLLLKHCPLKNHTTDLGMSHVYIPLIV